mmetsp:Transcript_3498/g.14490  ORF Transcript_3498/g.14490 Transcript_3498/m.14490 type:complete len:709 (+) Transcript_3498:709-2835(+)
MASAASQRPPACVATAKWPTDSATSASTTEMDGRALGSGARAPALALLPAAARSLMVPLARRDAATRDTRSTACLRESTDSATERLSSTLAVALRAAAESERWSSARSSAAAVVSPGKRCPNNASASSATLSLDANATVASAIAASTASGSDAVATANTPVAWAATLSPTGLPAPCLGVSENQASRKGVETALPTASGASKDPESHGRSRATSPSSDSARGAAADCSTNRRGEARCSRQSSTPQLPTTTRRLAEDARSGSPAPPSLCEKGRRRTTAAATTHSALAQRRSSVVSRAAGSSPDPAKSPSSAGRQAASKSRRDWRTRVRLASSNETDTLRPTGGCRAATIASRCGDAEPWPGRGDDSPAPVRDGPPPAGVPSGVTGCAALSGPWAPSLGSRPAPHWPPSEESLSKSSSSNDRLRTGGPRELSREEVRSRRRGGVGVGAAGLAIEKLERRWRRPRSRDNDDMFSASPGSSAASSMRSCPMESIPVRGRRTGVARPAVLAAEPKSLARCRSSPPPPAPPALSLASSVEELSESPRGLELPLPPRMRPCARPRRPERASLARALPSAPPAEPSWSLSLSQASPPATPASAVPSSGRMADSTEAAKPDSTVAAAATCADDRRTTARPMTTEACHDTGSWAPDSPSAAEAASRTASGSGGRSVTATRAAGKISSPRAVRSHGFHQGVSPRATAALVRDSVRRQGRR